VAPAPSIPKSAPLPALPMTPSSPFDDAIPSSFDLDVKQTAPVRPRPSRREPHVGLYHPPAAGPSLGERFRGPAWIAFIAIAIAVTDAVLTRTGEGITIGPVRLLWVGAGLGALAIVMAISRAIDD